MWGQEHQGAPHIVKSNLDGEETIKKQRNVVGDRAWGQGLEGSGDLYTKSGIMGQRTGTHNTYKQSDM